MGWMNCWTVMKSLRFLPNGPWGIVVAIVLLLTGGADDKTSAENLGGESYAVVLDE